MANIKKNILFAAVVAGLLGSATVTYAKHKSDVLTREVEATLREQEAARKKENFSVEIISSVDNVQREKNLFVNFYSNIYRSIADKLGIKDMRADLENRFETERKLFQDPFENVYGIRVMKDEDVVAFIILHPLDGGKGKRMRLQRCAIDTQRNTDKVVEALKRGMFKLFPKLESVATVVLKDSKEEIEMLKGFGFTECDLIDSSYDPSRYTSYELKKF